MNKSKTTDSKEEEGEKNEISQVSKPKKMISRDIILGNQVKFHIFFLKI